MLLFNVISTTLSRIDLDWISQFPTLISVQCLFVCEENKLCILTPVNEPNTLRNNVVNIKDDGTEKVMDSSLLLCKI